MRKGRNYYSRKLIPDFPVRVRRRPAYLKRFYYDKKFKIKNISKEFFKDKYELGEDRFFDRAPLPNAYYVNEITLMPKNKNTLFAFWEIRNEEYERLREEYHIHEDAVIKLHKEGKLFRKIKGLHRLGSYYILNVEADKEYNAILGFENNQGQFFEVARSKMVVVPSGKVSNIIDTVWGISKIVDKRVKMIKYHKGFLPENEELHKEILDSEKLVSISDSMAERFIGSSEKRFGGSSEKQK